MFFDRAAERAARSRAPSRYRLPVRALVDLTRSAHSLDPREGRAQEARCPVLGNTAMSASVSPMKTSAMVELNPGMLIRSSRAEGKGAIRYSIPALRASMSEVWALIRCRC